MNIKDVSECTCKLFEKLPQLDAREVVIICILLNNPKPKTIEKLLLLTMDEINEIVNRILIKLNFNSNEEMLENLRNLL